MNLVLDIFRRCGVYLRSRFDERDAFNEKGMNFLEKMITLRISSSSFHINTLII